MSKDESERALAELAELFPTLSPEELEKAEENLRRFVDVVIRICEQETAYPDTNADPTL